MQQHSGIVTDPGSLATEPELSHSLLQPTTVTRARWLFSTALFLCWPSQRMCQLLAFSSTRKKKCVHPCFCAVPDCYRALSTPRLALRLYSCAADSTVQSDYHKKECVLCLPRTAYAVAVGRENDSCDLTRILCQQHRFTPFLSLQTYALQLDTFYCICLRGNTEFCEGCGFQLSLLAHSVCHCVTPNPINIVAPARIHTERKSAYRSTVY